MDTGYPFNGLVSGYPGIRLFYLRIVLSVCGKIMQKKTPPDYLRFLRPSRSNKPYTTPRYRYAKDRRCSPVGEKNAGQVVGNKIDYIFFEKI